MSVVGVVSTSINPRPEAYAQWADAGDLIVAGDRNSPPELEAYVKELSGTYLTPDAQESWHFSPTIGWNCVQRRNVAIMEAFRRGYEYVVTVDDDNLPQHGGRAWIAGHLEAMSQLPLGSTVGSETGFLNTGIFCHPQFHQRGVPYGLNTSAVVRVLRVNSSPEIVVSQAQVLGNPDCDAVERLVHDPRVKAVNTSAVITPGTYAAFNSQATVWKRDWAPVMACLPYVGRYDDILASFIFARLSRVYDVALHVGVPAATSYTRNRHDAVRDLMQEMWGMNHVFEFIKYLDDAYVSSSMPLWMAYSELVFACRKVLPAATLSFIHGWLDAWKEIVG